MPNHDQIPPDEITEEVPKPAEGKRITKWELSKPPNEHMTAAEKAAFDALVVEEIAEAERDLREAKGRLIEISEEDRKDIGFMNRVREEERRYQEALVAVEHEAAGERKDYLVRLFDEAKRIVKDVAREDDLDTMPGWALAALECIPYVSATYAFFGKELRTKRDPMTDRVVGVRLEDMTAARRAVYLTVGELTPSAKMAIAITKIFKKSMSRALKDSASYALARTREALTSSV